MKGRIRRRGNGTYELRWDLGRDPHTGVRTRASETFHGTREDAETRLREILQQFETGRVVKPTNTTLAAYLEKWLNVAVRPRVSVHTAESYEENLRRYVFPTLGGIALKRLTPLMVQELYQRMSAGELTGRALAPVTVRRLHMILHNALTQACKWRELGYAPTADVDLPRARRKSVIRALTLEQLEAFLGAAREDRFAALWFLSVFTGCRPEELLGLRWPNVLWDVSAIRIEEVLVRSRRVEAGRSWRLEPPKTARSRRTIPLPKIPVLSLLRGHQARQDEERAFFGQEYAGHGFVFATFQGEPMHHGNLVVRHFKPLLKRAGLPLTTRLYDLRHSHATQLLAQGENVKVVADRLGHASAAFTMDTYVQLVGEEQKTASERMAERLGMADMKAVGGERRS